MGDPDSLLIFEAQCKNVLALEKAKKQIVRSINGGLSRGDYASVEVSTRMLAVIYSSWAEVSFSKLIHTPYGFTRDEIEQIKAANRRNVKTGWGKCLELALKRIGPEKPGEIPNKRQELTRLVQKYIIAPSTVRNKIAHGQWCLALNSEHTLENPSITAEIAGLDVVKISILFGAFHFIQRAIEDLIESPKKAHRRDYYIHVIGLEQFIATSASWTMEKRIQALKLKASFYGRQCNCGHEKA